MEKSKSVPLTLSLVGNWPYNLQSNDIIYLVT